MSKIAEAIMIWVFVIVAALLTLGLVFAVTEYKDYREDRERKSVMEQTYDKERLDALCRLRSIDRK